MTSHSRPPAAAPDTPTPFDHRLREALASLPLPADAAAESLQQRAFSAWRSTVGTAAPRPAGWGVVALQRRWLLGGVGLAMGLLAMGLWVNRPDPVLQELLQPDVLSQMAADQF